MNRRRIVGWIVVGAVTGCGSDRASMPSGPIALDEVVATASAPRLAKVSASMAMADSSAAPPSPRQPSPTTSQMIIRTGAVSIEVDSVEVAVRRVGELAVRSGGFVANSAIQTGPDQRRSATIEIKVPATSYDGAVDGLRGIGEMKSASTMTQDVGEEYVDVRARVANARKLEDRLLTLLATRTGKLDDVLSVERELARVREEIERFDGRIRYLEAKVAMSTIAVTVFEPGPIVGQPGDHPFADALRESWRNFVGVVAGAIALSGGLLPILAVVAVAAWLARRWGRTQQAPPAV